MDKNFYCVIMAGGVGSRFWPLSRQEHPKQFLDILGTGRTLLQMTFDRFKDVCPSENFLVVTSQEYVDKVKEQLPEIPVDNILGEPARRNTAPCAAYAAFKIKKKNPAATMVVTPADHFIVDTGKFRKVVEEAMNFAKDRVALVTIGIKPTRPETGYGYIQMCGDCDATMGIVPVRTFTEKPDYEMAKVFVENGEFLWNSGIFIWSVKSIMLALEKYMPEMFTLFDDLSKYYTENEKSFIEDVYTKVKATSIDYGIMEQASDVYVYPADFGWSDLGTWGSLYEYSAKDENKNAVSGNLVKLFNTKNSIVKMPDNKLVVLNGVSDLIVAEYDGMILISAKSEEQKIRQIINEIKLEFGEKYV